MEDLSRIELAEAMHAMMLVLQAVSTLVVDHVAQFR